MNPDQTITLNQIAMNIDQSILMLYRINYDLLFLITVFGPLIKVFFAWTCYAAMKKIPSDKQTMPAWCCWLFVIPVAGYIFEWIMLPFAIPSAIKNHMDTDSNVKKRARTLRIIALIYLIASLTFAFPYGLLIFGPLVLVFWLIYWVKIKKIRKFLTS